MIPREGNASTSDMAPAEPEHGDCEHGADARCAHLQTTQELVELDKTGDVYVPPRSWSRIWERFYCRRSVPGKTFCILCPEHKGFAYIPGMQSTGTLGTHLRVQHNIHLISPVVSKAPSNHLKRQGTTKGAKAETVPTGQVIAGLAESEKPVLRPQKITFDSKTMQRVLVAYVDNFIINDLQPFNSVENPSLREFCSTIQPRYAFPTSQEVQDAFEARHATLSQAVDIVLSTICGTENFSASCCTHIVGNEQKFTKARIYWVGDNWALNRLTISTPSIMAGSEADTFRSIKDKFTAAGGDFASLVHCVASEITGAEKALADDEAIACVSVGPRSLKRTLDRAFEEGSKRGDVCALLSKVREHLLCIQSSPILLDMARSACEELNIPFSLDFVDTNDEETWLATMAMLDATVRSEKVFTMLYGREAISPQLHVLSDTDFELASQICGILQPLKTALEQLEAPNVSIGTLYVVSQSILRQLDQSTYVVVCTPGGSTEMAEASLLSAAAALRRRFRDGFARYWSRVTADASQLDVMHLAAALDARFKSLKSAPEAEQEKAWKTVKTKAQELDRATQDCDGGEMLEAKRQKRASSFFGDGAGNEFSETTLDDEIRRYKEFPQCSLSQDHLAWWAAHNRTYPRLAKVARKYLSVQIGGYQSATELADQDIKLRRLERLGHHVAQKVLFCNDNLPLVQ